MNVCLVLYIGYCLICPCWWHILKCFYNFEINWISCMTFCFKGDPVSLIILRRFRVIFIEVKGHFESIALVFYSLTCIATCVAGVWLYDGGYGALKVDIDQILYQKSRSKVTSGQHSKSFT